MNNTPVWDTGLISKYNLSGPRYTSYPTAVQFSEDFDQKHYQSSAWHSSATDKPLSLYFHIPFCQHVCYYCACNKIVTRNTDQAETYLKYLFKEIELQAELYNAKQEVQQLHLGGGTPTFLNEQQISALINKVSEHFTLSHGNDIDYSIELDPREVDWPMMATLRDSGFTRISIGVQDLDPVVQKAVNRLQTEEQIQSVLDAAHAMAFKSVHMDLIYGLPHQTLNGFMTTINKIITMQPDRVSLFNYAHLPHRFMPQRRISEADLPDASVKLQILQQATRKLLDSGYVYIGMDHFALPDDELAIAQEEGTLHRNFQGYTTHSQCDLVGMGVSSISKVGKTYAQNHTDMAEYQSAIDENRLPLHRGLKMTKDDQIRQSVINELICHFRLEPAMIEQQYGIDFPTYFLSELINLKPLEQDGLVSVTPEVLEVTPAGKLLIRNICMVFDRYFQQQNNVKHFSKVI
ncbi:coproporphyrinogen III oxidase [Endozoicomonas montiporae]|uniref:Coproporphyrinogen-III oxidase n=2 Tax=Endozoicomonas montiporae TaxID=1027273 RepID=A0A081N5S0_9GAMM|nr:oxygen-independent coproporphyrinogen III oxidase [Endozoicomonas montiporae]AMO57309.1 oxygen-independent coproporphyrinogen III oxidase [Endozoicomonas montiporae CL-33]KEQ13793.1 coproporphyrinogen III oxidase [Endozoicomonas montiporae]